MNKKFIFFMLVISFGIIAYGIEDKRLKIDFTSLDNLTAETSLEEDLYVSFFPELDGGEIGYNIIDKPIGAQVKFENGEFQGKIKFTKAGKYEILFNKEPNFKKNVKIMVKSNYQFTEKEIYDIIQGGYTSKNLDLVQKYLEILEKSYPYSLYTKSSLYDLFELSIELGKYRIAEKSGEEILRRYKLNDYEKNELLIDLAEVYEKIGQTEKSFEIYKGLALENSYYAYILAKKYMHSNIYTKEAIIFLEEIYSETLDKDIAAYLAQYYYENDREKSIPYYKRLKNYESLAEIYIESKKFEELENLKENMDEKTLERVELLKFKYELEEKAKGYLKIAEENFAEGKFGIAQTYYQRVLDTSRDEKLIKDTLYKKVELYSTKGDYARALEELNNYIDKYGAGDEIEVLNYFAILNYKLENYTESKVYFDRILEEYPETTWARRAKIYSIKITKKLK